MFRDETPSVPSLLSSALYANSTMHSSGFWLDGEGKISASTFSLMARFIIDYLEAVA